MLQNIRRLFHSSRVESTKPTLEDESHLCYAEDGHLVAQDSSTGRARRTKPGGALTRRGNQDRTRSATEKKEKEKNLVT